MHQLALMTRFIYAREKLGGTDYPRASQNTMSVSSKMATNPNNENDEAKSKYASSTPFNNRFIKK